MCVGGGPRSLSLHLPPPPPPYLAVRVRGALLGELACGRQAFIATWLFDPSMSALPIILKQNSVSVGLFTLLRERELGLDRRETG